MLGRISFGHSGVTQSAFAGLRFASFVAIVALFKSSFVYAQDFGLPGPEDGRGPPPVGEWAPNPLAEPPPPGVQVAPAPQPPGVAAPPPSVSPGAPPGALGPGGGGAGPGSASGGAAGSSGQSSLDKRCIGSFEDAKGVCIDTLGLTAIAGSLGAGAVGSSPATNLKEQCKKASMLGKFSALLNAGKGAACEAMILRCRASCPALPEEGAASAAVVYGPPDPNAPTETTDRLRRRCNSYQFLVAQMTAQAVAAGASSVLSNQCKNLTTLAPIKPPPLGAPPAMAALPSYAPTDCANPANQESPICKSQICLNNPSAPGCSVADVDAAGVFQGDPAAGGVPFQSAINENPPIDPNVKPVAPTGARGGEVPNTGSGGPLGGGGGGLQRVADDGPRGGGSPGFNTNVVGGAGQPGGFGGFAAPNARTAGGGGGGGFMDRLKDKLGLKGLLPDKNQYKRGPASMNAEITGANGLTIWQKASRQYVKDPYLKP